MNISFFEFLKTVSGSPPILIAVILTIGVIFVNGWTDAPNAIVSCVCSHTLSMRKAVLLAALCNFSGVFIMSTVSHAVAENIFSAADFSHTSSAQSALCAALLSVIILAVVAWLLGIPTSESHAIISALIGAGIACGANINTRVLIYTVIGLILSVTGGFILGFYLYGIIRKRAINPKFLRILQIVGAMMMSFMHGAQDGQKFISILLVAVFAGKDAGGFAIPLWAAILCSIVMALGTMLGGGRIIRKVGQQMVGLDLKQGVAADIAGSISLFFSTALGLPVSTTHAKTCSIMGCGYAASGLDKASAKSMLIAWAVTFPACFIMGFIFTKIMVM